MPHSIHLHAHLLFIVLTLLALPRVTFAQLVSDGATATINNVNFLTGSLTVGTNGDNTTLTIGVGGTVSNSLGQIGLNAGSDSNAVIVQSASGRWFNSSQLSVGVSGDANLVRLRTGAFISAGSVRVGENANSDNNSVVITGAGSTWTNTGNFTVGFAGSGNSLLMSGGANLANDNGIIGNQAGSVSNLVYLSDAATVWTNRGDLRVGGSGAYNTLIVTNGATAGVGGDFLVSRNFDANNNAAFLLGGNIIVKSNTVTGNGLLQLDSGLLSTSNLTSISGDFIFNGGTLAMVSGRIGNSDNVMTVGENAAPSPARLLVNSGLLDIYPGSLHLGVGNSNSFCLVTNGAIISMVTGLTYVGNGSDGNILWITGNGSIITNTYGLTVGQAGSRNMLVLTNGGTANCSAGLLSAVESSSYNTAVVTGSGSCWTNRGSLTIGHVGSFNQLIVTNGGRVDADSFIVGGYLTGSNNLTVVDGSNSLLNAETSLTVGRATANNQFILTNGGKAFSQSGNIGDGDSTGNQATVTGAGSVWSNDYVRVGYNSSNTKLLIAQGGRIESTNAIIGFYDLNTNNQAIVTGPGSVWNTTDLTVGYASSDSRLYISNNASVYASFSATLGRSSSASNGLVQIDNGSFTTSPSANLWLHRGTLRLNGGTVACARLVMTNTEGFLEFNQGTLNLMFQCTNNNGRTFLVGNGSGSATLALSTNFPPSTTFLYQFNQGLLITNNATLTGNGVLFGSTTIAPGGSLSPGFGLGKIIFSNSPPNLKGIARLEISQNGSVATNDNLTVNGTITYGGSLSVSNIGPSTLTAGKNFRLFTATTYAGAFTNISLPTPPLGLAWTNKLLLDGSIELVSGGAPIFNTTSVNGTNLVLALAYGTAGGTYKILTATNLTTPIANWVTNNSGTFDGSGNATITNAISKTTPSRFYRIKTP